MTRIYGCLTAILLAGALAMPMSALAAQNKAAGGGGGGGHHAGGGGGGGHHAGGGGGGHAARIGGGGGRSFSRIGGGGGGRSANFRSFNRGTSFNRSALRSQRLHALTQSNTSNSALRNSGVQTNAQTLRNLRRNNTAGITSQTTRQGRFAARAQTRGANFAAHRAWRHGLRAGFVAWYGPIFWPYAYSDIFDYAFWPGGYDDGFWDYAYDDFVDGVFWGGAGPPADYAYAEPNPVPRASHAGVRELCTQPGSGITAWPFADIERKVGLNDEQKALLGDVRKSASDAAATFKASCPAENQFPLTPPGRLQSMTARLQGTLDAVKIVRPSLEKFYASLSDEQKERFNALGPTRVANNAETTAALPQDAKSCADAKPGLANLPIEKIADVVKPTDAQQGGLKQLQDATAKAVSLLQAACPADTPITPPGRLAAMEKRLQAMIDAAKTVKPALDNFYASLSDEQKARFDRIGGQLAQFNG
jgi:LTXXQ motif family protein